MIGRARWWRRAAWAGLTGLGFGLALAGCAPRVVSLAGVESALRAGDPVAAVAAHEALGGGDRDLLRLLERGYLLHLAGRWAESNRVFEQVERRADELYTRSLSNEALALLSSDWVRPYRGAPYELQLVHYYRALNYAAMALTDDAIVEARKANEALERYQTDGPPADRAPQTAFLQYVTGLLYSAADERNDAIVSFRDAARLYRDGAGPPPRWLSADYHDAARRVGLDSEADSLERSDPRLARGGRRYEPPNVILFLESGFVPALQPVDLTFPVFESDGHHGRKNRRDAWIEARNYVDSYGGDPWRWRADRVTLDHVVRVAFPELVDRPSMIVTCEAVMDSAADVSADAALDLGRAARADFDRRVPSILLRSVARALVKEGARKAADRESEALGLLVNLAGAALEQADTRSFTLLPGRIDMAMARLPDGPHRLAVRFLGPHGEVVEERHHDIFIRTGTTLFLSIRSFR